MSAHDDGGSIGKPYKPIPMKQPRGLLGQIRLAIIQPRTFFSTLASSTSQNWFLVAILILGAVGASAIRQQELANPNATIGSPSVQLPDSPESGVPADVSMTWRPALLASSRIVLNWLFLSAVLMIVPLSRGVRPQFGANLRMVIWAYLPLGLMAILQLFFYATGGQPGNPGLSGMVKAPSASSSLPMISTELLRSAAQHLTIFNLWTICLVYLGARHMLKGSSILIIVLIVLWCASIIMLPVAVESVNNQIAAPLPTIIPTLETALSRV
jgi:hypothetical protein